MMARPHCDCTICRMEKALLAELSHECAHAEYQSGAASTNVLAGFPTPLDLLRKIHAPDDPADNSFSDPLLLELLEQNWRAGVSSIWQRLLLQVFIPTIHRTASQVTASFPSLAREDVSQHILCSFLEFLPSRELQLRRSHLAFTIARKLRRRAFRWAIHEAQGTLREEPDPAPAIALDNLASSQSSGVQILLHQFLDDCQRIGALGPEERKLLTEFKIEGLSCIELARRNGHSAIAIQHRIQRLLDRLRRIAAETENHRAQQLQLFRD